MEACFERLILNWFGEVFYLGAVFKATVGDNLVCDVLEAFWPVIKEFLEKDLLKNIETDLFQENT